MCSIDLDPCQVWEETVALMSRAHFKGRLHECDGCGATIKRGDPYVRHSNLFEGSWSREKMCFACWWSREVFADAHEQSFSPSSLWDQLQGCIAENSGYRYRDEKEAKRLDEWRPHLAALKRRFRLSPAWRRQRERRRVERLERLRRIVLARDGFGAGA